MGLYLALRPLPPKHESCTTEVSIGEFTTQDVDLQLIEKSLPYLRFPQELEESFKILATKLEYSLSGRGLDSSTSGSSFS